MAFHQKSPGSIALTAIAILCMLTFFSCFKKTTGTLRIPGLTDPVSVLRDDQGMAYIYAENHLDAMMAQGFVTAQDRVFNMELTRMAASGRISEILGESGRPTDIEMRTLGFLRNAKKHAALLTPEAKQRLQSYVDGINAYIETRSFFFPFQAKLVGMKPEKWTIEDPIAIMYFMGWNSSANLKSEIVAQMLVDKFGLEKAKEIFPLNINPDDESSGSLSALKDSDTVVRLGLLADRTLRSYLKDDRGPRLGSNNWAIGPQLAEKENPIIANDPHLSSSNLPGTFYPLGIITPEYRAVGLSLPGAPGISIGRVGNVAIGITNEYGDTQDLYVETIDPVNPDNYMEGTTSIPFEVIEETIRIKDSSAPGGFKEEPITIRLTRRGPVVSGILADIGTDKVMTVRWSPYETLEPDFDSTNQLFTKTAEEFKESLRHVTFLTANFVFGDTDGNFGWHTTGRIPIRSQGDGTIPFVVKDGIDNWEGWIPHEEMPGNFNPDRGWVGTCNHKIVKKDFPYYFSSYFSPSYRYRRLIELMETPGAKDANASWEYQRDIKNMMAEKIAPIMASALAEFTDTQEIAALLNGWNHMDDPDLAAPTLFQAIYRKFAILVYEDELGSELSEIMLGNWYFWQERLYSMVIEGNSSWFDNITTGVEEDMNILFHQAALEVVVELKADLGPNPEEWLWGDVHRMEFYDMLMPGKTDGIWGGGSYPFPGSGETLHRGLYLFFSPFKVKVPACARMVVDLNDDDKIMAVLAGGVSGHLFDPHRADQVEPYINGEKRYWWFSDAAINEHAETELLLKP